jgi:hypothetical protein
MWIMVEPVAEIPFRIRRSPTQCYRCNNGEETMTMTREKKNGPRDVSWAVGIFFLFSFHFLY